MTGLRHVPGRVRMWLVYRPEWIRRRLACLWNGHAYQRCGTSDAVGFANDAGWPHWLFRCNTCGGWRYTPYSQADMRSANARGSYETDA